MYKLKLEGEKIATKIRQRDTAFSQNQIGKARGIHTYVEQAFKWINKLDVNQPNFGQSLRPGQFENNQKKILDGNPLNYAVKDSYQKDYMPLTDDMIMPN